MMQQRARVRGFTLIEVLVALVIIGVGMLGIAKIQALAYASTGTAALRSLAAIEASSMASAMRANRNYWTLAALASNQTITIAAAAITGTTDGALSVAGLCTFGSPPCGAAQVAAYDLHAWASSLNTLLPGDTATIFCPKPVPVAGFTPPVSCTITVGWTERNTAINAQSTGNVMGGTLGPSYTLYVQP